MINLGELMPFGGAWNCTPCAAGNSIARAAGISERNMYAFAQSVLFLCELVWTLELEGFVVV